MTRGTQHSKSLKDRGHPREREKEREREREGFFFHFVALPGAAITMTTVFRDCRARF